MPPSPTKTDDPSYMENEIDYGREKGDGVPYDKEDCSMQEYEIMKVSAGIEQYSGFFQQQLNCF